MDNISIPLIKANDFESLGVKVKLSLSASSMLTQNSPDIVS